MKNFIYILTYFAILTTQIYPQWRLIGLDGENVRKLSQHPSDQNTIYAGSSYTGGNSVGGLFKSTDSGITWDTLITNISPSDFVVDYQNSDIIYMVGGVTNGLIKTTDGGNSWFSSSNGIDINSGTVTYSIAIDPINPNILFCGTLGPMGGNFYKTTNGGLNWFTPSFDTTLFYDGVAVIEFDQFNPNMLYAGRAMNGSLFRSPDGGVNFDFAGYENGGGIYSLKFGRNSNEMYATSSWSFAYPAGIFRTIDGGISWENLGGGFIGNVSVWDVALKFSNKNYIYITANAEEDTSGVYVKIDDEPWILIGLNNEFISSLLIKDNLLYAGTDNGIFSRDLISSIDEETLFINKKSFVLYQNYPNPFNPKTSIQYAICSRQLVTLKVYDVLGNEVATLVNKEQEPGVYEVEFNGANYSSGVYYYIIRAGNFIDTKKFVLLK